MRIGVDARCLLRVSPRGEGQTLLRLYGEIARRHPSVEIVLFSDAVRPESAALAATIPGARIAALDLPGWRWRTWQRFGLPWLTLRHRVDLLHGFSTIVGSAPGLPIALTVHDLIPALASPQDSPMRRRYLRQLERSVRAARIVLCPSISTRDDFARLGLSLAGREVRVIPWGPTVMPAVANPAVASPAVANPAVANPAVANPAVANPAARPASAMQPSAEPMPAVPAPAARAEALAELAPMLAGDDAAIDSGIGWTTSATRPLRPRPAGPAQPDAAALRRPSTPPTVVAFAASDPRKNVDRLIDAFAVSATRAVGGRLVLLGADSQATIARFRARTAAAGVGEAVETHGFLPAAERDALMQRAQLLVYPSLYEGFGLPVLDAMSCGVPVAASNRSSIPEVGGDAVEYFDPIDVASIAAAIDRVALQPHRAAELRERGLRRAGLYGWARCADDYMNAFERILR